MKVKIKDLEITLKNSFRSLIIYEAMTKKSFKPETITDVIVYFFSVISASANPQQVDWDDYMDWLDNNPTAITDFQTWLTSSMNFNGQFGGDDAKKKVKK